MSLTGLIGGQLLMGIRIVIDARQAASGARQVERSLIGIKKQALNTDAAVQKSTQNLAKSLQGIGIASTMVGMAATRAGHAMIGGFIRPSYEAAKEFNSAMTTMKIVTKSSNAELAELGALMKSTSMGTMFDPSEGALAFTRLAAFTGDVEEAKRDLPALQDFMAATFGEVDPEDAARLLSSAYEKFRHVLPDMRRASDIMIEAANVSPFEFRDLPQFVRSMRDVTVTANTSMEQVFALGGALRGVLSPAESGRMLAAFSTRLNQMGAMISEYANKLGISFEEAMKTAKFDHKTRAFIKATSELGVEFYDKVTGKQKDFVENIVTMIERFDEVKNTMGDDDFHRLLFRLMGRHASAAMSTFLSYQRGGEKAGAAIRKFTKQIEASGGTSEWASDVMAESAAGIEKAFSSAATRLKISFGDQMMKIFQPVLTSLAGFMDRLTLFMDKNPAIARAVSVLVISLSGLLIVGGSLTVMFGAVALWLSFIIPVLKGLGTNSIVASLGLKSLHASLFKVAGVFGIMYFAYNHFMESSGAASPKIISNFKSLASNLLLVSKGVAEWWTGKGGSGSAALYKELKEKGLLGMVDTILDLKENLVAFGKGFVFALKPAFDAVGAVIYGVLKAVELLLRGWDGLRLAFGLSTSRELKGAREAFQVLGILVGGFMYYRLVKLALAWGTVAKAALVAGAAGTAATAPILLAIGAILSVVGLLHGTKKGRMLATEYKVGKYDAEQEKETKKRKQKEIADLARRSPYMSKEEYKKQLAVINRYTPSRAVYNDELIKANMSQDPEIAAKAIRNYLQSDWKTDTSALSDEQLINKGSRTNTALLTTEGIQAIIKHVEAIDRLAKIHERREIELNTSRESATSRDVSWPKTYTVNLNVDARGNTDGHAIANKLVTQLGDFFRTQTETAFGQ